MNGVGTFIAVVLTGFLGFLAGALLRFPEVGAIVFAAAMAAACVVYAIHAIQKNHGE